jgi:hypothetical protein
MKFATVLAAAITASATVAPALVRETPPTLGPVSPAASFSTKE